MTNRKFERLWKSRFYLDAKRIAVDRLNNRLLVMYFNGVDIGAVDLATGEESILL